MKLAKWCFQCPSCGTWASTLDVGINGESQGKLDEKLREVGLATLRKNNNLLILQRLREAGLNFEDQILDIGSGHGWFVFTAEGAGFNASGIEPDEAIVAFSRSLGIKVRQGYFPAA